MTKQPFRFTFFLLMCLSIPLTAPAQTVNLPDANLRAAIEAALGKTSGATITVSDMAALTRLEARKSSISDLTGLEHATNLKSLDFWNNSISDISALAGLTNLETLLLEHNSISDISALAGLTNLEILLLKHNLISDISAVAGLTNLTELYLGSNKISDISLLTGLTNLTHLYLSDNSISDISAVAELTNLIALNLWENSISDISVVAGLTKLQLLILSRNSISDISAVAGLTNLETLHLDRNSISDISAVAGLTKLTWLALDRNSISDISALVANAGLGSGDRINVKVNPLNPVSIDTHIPALLGRGVTVEFDDIVAGAEVDIPDSNLRAAIAAALSKATGDTITTSDMASLNHLRTRGPKISDLTGLEYATNLTLLEFRTNSISDISAVAGLTNLRALHLSGNPISDISAVAGLTNLASLTLQANSISDISAVAGLTNLSYLNLNWNSISDISAVAGLTNLRALYLSGNSISDISAVTGLTNLYSLSLRDNSISDISAVAGLTKLTWLALDRNSISDISALVANAGLGSGDTVDVKGNPLSAVSIDTHIPALQSRGVTVSFDDRAHPALLKISGDNQKGAAFAPLSQPFIVEVQDRNGSALAGISVTFAVIGGSGTLSTTITRTDANGRAQSTLTLGPNLGTNTVQVSADGIEVPVTFHAIADTESPSIMADVNRDGNVNILDLVSVASAFGSAGVDLAADVNGDEVINILDLVLVAGMFEGEAAAPSARLRTPETLTAVEVQHWLTDARLLEIRDPIMTRGFVMLEQLLIALTPSETELLPNYPNPFNPETWIPYRLAEEAFVTLTIYDLNGHVVRTLDVGDRIAAVYEGRSKAIHWDGRNEVGEQVASGVYFYHLSAGDYSATRKMLNLK